MGHNHPVASRRQQRWRQKVRKATVRYRTLPDFVIIGVQGCGTTSAYAWLSGHPQVRPAREKEIHYFDRHYEQGERWYRSQFPLVKKHTITGEATPYLFLHPLVPERVARDLPPSTPLILLLRNPADRAISRYRRAVAQGNETETLERALALEPERLAAAHEAVMLGRRSAHETLSYVTGGHYAKLLRDWHRHVGTDRIVTFESEQLLHSDSERQDLLDLLGLAPYDAAFPVINTYATAVDEFAQERLQLEEYFRPHNEELFELLGRRLWGQ
jgi:sulfotransferase family protein